MRSPPSAAARVPTGDYTVIFGRQPVADLLNNLVLPACHAGAFYASSTPFLGRLGRAVAVPELGIYDHGALPGLIGSKGITCEGLADGAHRPDQGRRARRAPQPLVRRPAAPARSATSPRSSAWTVRRAARALVPRNGFRYDGGGRSFERRPSTSACNVVIEGGRPVTFEELISRGRGRALYRAHLVHVPDQWPPRGRLHVHGGRRLLRHPRRTHHRRRSAANAIRINDNITRLLQSVVGVTKDVKGTMVWAADEVVYAPELAVSGVHVDAIAHATED